MHSKGAYRQLSTCHCISEGVTAAKQKLLASAACTLDFACQQKEIQFVPQNLNGLVKLKNKRDYFIAQTAMC